MTIFYDGAGMSKIEAKNLQLEAIREKWPEYKDQIMALYYKDTKFRAICDDYYLSLQYLNKFRREFSEKRETIEEYEKLLNDLAIELQGRIDKK
jgi:hypothetical protein